MSITVSYNPKAGGWTSFHSYVPQWMIGMNNMFFTFYQGKPYRHYTNNVRNNYYGLPTPTTAYDSTVTLVFNDSPVETKMFKTIELEGNASWKADMISDLHAGLIEASYFVPKEGTFFANARRTVESGATVDLSQISTQGAGSCSGVTSTPPSLVIDFTLPAPETINSLINIGDVIYFRPAAAPATFVESGPITAIDRTTTPQTITVNPAVGIPTTGDFVFAVKNSVAESYGLRGHYNTVKLTNGLSTFVELFAVSSEIFKSYP
jgi:hypothetical protein